MTTTPRRRRKSKAGAESSGDGTAADSHSLAEQWDALLPGLVSGR